jgi:hypothetical protein
MLNQQKFLTTLSTDESGMILLEFPEDLLEITGWKEGDELEVQTFPGRVVISNALPLDRREETLMSSLRKVLS